MTIKRKYYKTQTIVLLKINVVKKVEIETMTKFGNSEFVDKTTNYYNLDMIISVRYRVKSQVVKKYLTTASDEKKYKTNYYNLDAVILVGYRVNSDRAIQFRRRFYQKITDIYATSIDYDKKSPITIKFFKKVQNKMHYVVSHQTAAEIIYNRADSEKENMGLTNWKNSPNGKILETDVVIVKNYLSKHELEQLELIVSAFLDLAEARAKRNIPMTMEDWATIIDKYLLSDDRDILKDAGKISHEIACDKALTDFEKYRVKQDKLYESDFDLLLKETNK